MIIETKSFRVYCDDCGVSIINNAEDDDKIYSTEQDAEADVVVRGWTKIQISDISSLRVVHLCSACGLDTLKALNRALAGKRRLTKCKK